MIKLKNNEQLEIMKIAGRITGEALYLAGEAVKEGVTTLQIDKIVRTHIEKCGAKPSFLGYGGFPASACVSVNDEVIHGIPSEKKILKEGDIVKVDVGAFYKGFHGDAARTFAVGKISEEAARLIEVTKACFYEGAAAAVINNRIGDIGAAVEAKAVENGFSVVRRYVGHGIGHELHEDPEVPNYGNAGKGARLYAGMTLAIEPMINVGTYNVRELADKWTVVTADGKLSAHYENTVAITENGPLLLTDVETVRS
jgi:methionyl aminopeptidase